MEKVKEEELAHTKHGPYTKKGYPIRVVRVISETKKRASKPGYKKVMAIVDIAGHLATRHCEIKA